jgi:hypothetical protein
MFFFWITSLGQKTFAKFLNTKNGRKTLHFIFKISSNFSRLLSC